MHWIVWLTVGWIVLSVVLALVIGRAIRIADEREFRRPPADDYEDDKPD
ncbi:hypothetical protein [Rhodococcus sp. SGAir0479]|nr:hypothetical protein [Rhodococcus sp. SGAir0479]